MARIHANGIDIEYEEFGPKTGTTVLLIMGLGAQLTRWPLEFIEILTSRGYRSFATTIATWGCRKSSTARDRPMSSR
jgi:pimeloyl-ACP methyl ester carboxylesterase